VQRATQPFVDNCSACHGTDGKGKREFGAPNLTDKDWLYGGTKSEIRAQIVKGKGGVMPTWGARLEPMTIDALAVYVHSLGGGE
jgi:cytochrome c oxidase cbb3-type subunit 3